MPPVNTLVRSRLLGDCFHACTFRSSEAGFPICTSCFSNRFVSFHFFAFTLFLFLFIFLCLAYNVPLFVFSGLVHRNSGSSILAAAAWYPESSVTLKLISFAGTPAAATRCTEVLGYTEPRLARSDRSEPVLSRSPIPHTRSFLGLDAAHCCVWGKQLKKNERSWVRWTIVFSRQLRKQQQK